MLSSVTLRSVLLVVVLLIAGCGDDENQAEASTFTGVVCSSVQSWMTDMVKATNAFSTDSPDLSVGDRRARYVRTFDDLAAITADLRERLQQAPTDGTDAGAAETMRSLLLDAAATVNQQITDNQRDAAGEADDSYARTSVVPDYLFSGTEKAMSTVFKTLNERANELGLEGLQGSCGRE